MSVWLVEGVLLAFCVFSKRQIPPKKITPKKVPFFAKS